MKSLNYEQVKDEIAKLHRSDLQISILLDRPQSDMNIGHIFRLSDAAKITEVIILNPSFHINWKKIEKLSRKNSRHIPFTLISEVSEIDTSKDLIALEWTDESHSVFEYAPSKKEITLIIGNEQSGVQSALLDLCEASVHIPMYGLHSSMNMAMATSVAVYQLLRATN